MPSVWSTFNNLPRITLQISISSPSQLVNCTKKVDHGLQNIACALAGGCVDSVAKAVFAHSTLRERILLKVLDLVNSECVALC